MWNENELGEMSFPLDDAMPSSRRGPEYEFRELNLVDTPGIDEEPEIESGFSFNVTKVESDLPFRIPSKSLSSCLDNGQSGLLKMNAIPTRVPYSTKNYPGFHEGPCTKQDNEHKQQYIPDWENDDDTFEFSEKLDDRMVNLRCSVRGDKPPDKINTFEDIKLNLTILRNSGFNDLTSVQAYAIPFILSGRDVYVRAPAGCGKTAAYLLPVLQNVFDSQKKTPTGLRTTGVCRPLALILAPVRELVNQIKADAKKFTRETSIKCGSVFGGSCKTSEQRLLQENPQVLIATPGRLFDHLCEGLIDFKDLAMVVFDEVMPLDDDAEDLLNIIQHSTVPANLQYIVFCSTEPEAEQRTFFENLIDRPLNLDVGPVCLPSEIIVQKVLLVSEADKRKVLLTLLERDPGEQFLIFVSSKDKADFLAGFLFLSNISVAAIHGDQPQLMRFESMNKFKTGEILVLVATDVASRGVFIPRVSQVVNYDMPHYPQDYLHRIGKARKIRRVGIVTSFYDDAKDWKILRFLTDILTESNNQVPQWIEKLIASNQESLGNPNMIQELMENNFCQE